MKVLDKILRRIGYVRQAAVRQYAAAQVNRLTASWVSTNTSADADIRAGLRPLRARSRDLAQNNDYVARYLNLVVTNLIGSGVKFQNKARDLGGSLDSYANQVIEASWADWGRAASFEGNLSWLDIQRMAAETVARDGEILIRIIRGKGAGNKYNFSLQLLEADHLDDQYNDPNRNIRMGIEYDANNRPIAYWIFRVHPGNGVFSLTCQNERIRVPAAEMIHLFYRERPSQSRGVPWAHPAMTRLNNLGAYEEAEIIAARVAASKMGIITTPTGTEYRGETDGEGNVIMEAEPGTFEQLPADFDFKMFDPTHPSGNFAPFLKSTLMGIASGLNVSYNFLANDLEKVNYSSLRAGALDERDHWITLQSWFVQNFCNPVFAAWLDMALLSSAINLPYSKFDKFNSPAFQPRRWHWVDPEKDINATVTAIKAGLDTRTRSLAERGLDFTEVVEQLAFEEKFLREKGVTVSLDAMLQQPRGEQNAVAADN